jgi:hypothetical protein
MVKKPFVSKNVKKVEKKKNRQYFSKTVLVVTPTNARNQGLAPQGEHHE